jgi:hypothetical protein
MLQNMISTSILFTDDTSVIINNPDPFVFQNGLKEVFNQLNWWFNTSLLILNFSKTEFIKFKTKNIYEYDLDINI